MDEDSEELELGEIFDESFKFRQTTWKIPNFSSLPNYVDYKVQSPPITFAEATWKLEVYPYGQTDQDSEGFIDLMIVRLDSRIPEHILFFKIFLKTRNGKEFESYSDCICFNYVPRGVIRYLKKSRFMSIKNSIAPYDVLTIVCQMRTEKIPVFNSFSEIESTISLLESPFKTFEQESKSSASICKGCDCISRAPVALSGLKTDLKELFLKQEDCDVIIKVKGQEFPAHRTILIARSPVFASTFRNDMKEKATGIVDIKDCDPSSFSDFLCFLYCENVENISTENVFSLFTTADKYDVQGLRSCCIDFMKENLSVDTFCNTITLALQHSEKELIKLSTDFFAKNLEEIIVTVQWQSFLLKNTIQGNELLIKALASKKK